MLFRQVFDGLEAGRDGLVTVGVVDGKVAFLSSSLTTDTSVTNEVVLSPEEAVQAAAKAAGQPAGSVSNLRSENGWLVLDVKGYTDPARARLVGVPTPTDGVRRAYEVLLMDVAAVDPIGAVNYIDAETGALLLRDGIVDYATDNPAWKVFAASPPLDYSTTDTRELWCWTITPSVPGCQQAVANSASPAPWDVDAATGHAVVPHARQQRASDGEVEFERRQPTGHQLRSLGDPRLRVSVDEPVVRGPL